MLNELLLPFLYFRVCFSPNHEWPKPESLEQTEDAAVQNFCDSNYDSLVKSPYVAYEGFSRSLWSE